MVRYGGPRFEFVFTHHFKNFEEQIRKEDNHRAAFLHQQKQQSEAAAAAAAEAQAAAAQAAPAVQGDAGGAADVAAASVEGRRGASGSSDTDAAGRHPPQRQPRWGTQAGKGTASIRRLSELAQPTLRGDPRYGSGTYGRCTTPLPKGVHYPKGRGGRAYRPGVDRDRIAPAWSGAGADAPWLPLVHSGTAIRNGMAMLRPSAPGGTTRSAAACRKGAPVRAAVGHGLASESASASIGGDGERGGDDGGPTRRGSSPSFQLTDDGRAPSVFSHASSTDAIADIGIRHTVYFAEPGRTRCGPHATEPHETATMSAFAMSLASGLGDDDYAGLSLPEITARLIHMQRKRVKHY